MKEELKRYKRYIWGLTTICIALTFGVFVFRDSAEFWQNRSQEQEAIIKTLHYNYFIQAESASNWEKGYLAQENASKMHLAQLLHAKIKLLKLQTCESSLADSQKKLNIIASKLNEKDTILKKQNPLGCAVNEKNRQEKENHAPSYESGIPDIV